MRPSLHTFKVTAPRLSEFPLDMLRFGKCWPTTSVDADAIWKSVRNATLEKPVITLTMVEDPVLFEEVRKRFSSFCWTVMTGAD